MVTVGPTVTVHRMSICSISALQTEIASCRDHKELLELGGCKYLLFSARRGSIVPYFY